MKSYIVSLMLRQSVPLLRPILIHLSNLSLIFNPLIVLFTVRSQLHYETNLPCPFSWDISCCSSHNMSRQHLLQDWSDLTPQQGKELAPQSWLKLFRRTSLFGEIFKGNIYTPKAHWFYVRFEQWNTFDTFEHLYLSNQATSVELMIREPEHLIIFNASILAAPMLFYRWKLESQKVIWPISCIYIYSAKYNIIIIFTR